MRSLLMRFPLILLMLMLAACNLSNDEDPTPTATTRPDAAGKPLVVINSPADRTTSLVNREILVSATATDQLGVTKMQLFVNGNIVKTVSSETASGQTTFNAVLSYVPTTTGDVVLRVIAYRNTVTSDPREITIAVQSENAPTQTQLPGGGPVATGLPPLPTLNPFDTTCRARADSGLNMRQGPSTSFGIIRVLGRGEIVPIIGRVGDNSWWQVLYGSVTTGWISAGYTTVGGNCATVPVTNVTPTAPAVTATFTPQPFVTQTPTTQPQPADLVIPSLLGPTTPTIPSGQSSVTRTYNFTVTNTGGDNTGQTTTSIQIIPGGNIISISTGNLRGGESVSLSADLTFTEAGNFRVEVKADSEGVVTELSEVNNSASLDVTVTKQP